VRLGRLEARPWTRPRPVTDPSAWSCGRAGIRAREGRVSATPHQQRADTIAGFLCAFALAIAGIAVARTPGLLAPVAIVIALVAARMSTAHRTLAAWTVGLAAAAFVAGMIVAIATDSALF
jgi:hypothetical protein